ncbi:MAG: TVP38/TMEM64 family protein, partial [Gammaproteobacteria bacterium]|nr:TVP38/TMEM64 family protein [Gammaproteobacteria bacterium]
MPVFAALIAGSLIVGALWIADRAPTLAAVESEIRAWGIWGPLASLVLAAAHAFVPFPLEALALANGMLFGFGEGLALTWFGSMVGAVLSWALARLAGAFVRWRLLTPKQRALVEAWRARHGIRVLLAARFMPAVSFSLVNYLAGLAGVRAWPFVWTTALGILPVTALVVGVGSGVLGRTNSRGMVAATALLAIIPFLPVLWRLARRRLAARHAPAAGEIPEAGRNQADQAERGSQRVNIQADYRQHAAGHAQ